MYFDSIDVARSFVTQVDPNGEYACTLFDTLNNQYGNLWQIESKLETEEINWQREGF
jgi:hypothetical protein